MSKSKKKKTRKVKRKLSQAEKRARRREADQYQTIFINGKQKRVKREQEIDGMPVSEFIENNADPIWLLQNGYYELLPESSIPDTTDEDDDSGEPPF